MIHEAELGLNKREAIYRDLEDRLVGVVWQQEDYRLMFGTGYVREYRYANPKSLHEPQVYEERLTYLRWGRVVGSFHNYAVSFNEHEEEVKSVTVYGVYSDTNNIEVMHSDACGLTTLQLIPEFVAWASLGEKLGV